jgi:hypothetical protein
MPPPFPLSPFVQLYIARDAELLKAGDAELLKRLLLTTLSDDQWIKRRLARVLRAVETSLAAIGAR